MTSFIQLYQYSDSSICFAQDINDVVSSIPNILPAIALDASAAWADWPSEVRDFEGKFLDEAREVVAINIEGLWRDYAIYYQIYQIISDGLD